MIVRHGGDGVVPAGRTGCASAPAVLRGRDRASKLLPVVMAIPLAAVPMALETELQRLRDQREPLRCTVASTPLRAEFRPSVVDYVPDADDAAEPTVVLDHGNMTDPPVVITDREYTTQSERPHPRLRRHQRPTAISPNWRSCCQLSISSDWRRNWPPAQQLGYATTTGAKGRAWDTLAMPRGHVLAQRSGGSGEHPCRR